MNAFKKHLKWLYNAKVYNVLIMGLGMNHCVNPLRKIHCQKKYHFDTDQDALSYDQRIELLIIKLLIWVK